jgi:ribosomal protein S18 acetylase RimI-like enzyme
MSGRNMAQRGDNETMEYCIRLYRGSDLQDLVAVSKAADELFAQAGVILPPDDPGVLVDQCDFILVAGDPLVGFVAAESVDGNTHITQLSVRPDLSRRGLGTALLEAAVERGAASGARAVTLTTFRDVPWNGPWYEQRGFEHLPQTEWGERLREIWAEEAAAGIVVAPRVAMRRVIANETA